jgi:outer membrane protein TolC
MRGKASFKKCIAPVLLCFLLIMLAYGTAICSEEKVLALDEMIEMALATSPELKMAEQDIRVAKGEVRQATGGQLPQVELVGISGPVSDAKVPTVQVVGKTGYLVSHDEDSVNIFGRLDFALTQPLYTFGKISNRKDAARLGLEAQKAGKEQRKNQVILNTKELYYAYLIASQGKGAAKDADAYISDATRRIKRLIELHAKNADPSDLYRLEAYAAQVKAFAAKAESGYRTAYYALKQAIGIPQNEEFITKETELPKNPANLQPEGEYVQRALQNRPEITQVKKGADAKGKLADAAKSDLYPSFFAAAVGSVSGAPGRQTLMGGENTYLTDQFNHAYGGFYAGAHWHVDFGIGLGNLDKARAEYEKMRDTQEFAERNIPIEVVKYYQDAVEAQKSWAAYEEAVVGARRWILAAFDNFDLGIGTAKDMLDAIDRYGKNEGDYLQSLYGYHVALARLDYAVGLGTYGP